MNRSELVVLVLLGCAVSTLLVGSMSNRSALLFLCFLIGIGACGYAQATESLELNAARVAGRKPSIVDDKQRPFVLCIQSTLDRTRERLRDDVSVRSLYNECKAEAEQALFRDITIPARSGHYHDYVCTDGTRLILPEDLYASGASEIGNYACAQCGAKYSGPKFSGAVRHAQHTRLIGDCLSLAVIGVLEDRADCTSKAASILTAYADAYPGRHTAATKGGIFFQSLDEAVHFIYLAQAYDLVRSRNALSIQEAEHIEQNLLWESAEGLIRCGVGGNWGSWHLSAVGVIGLATGHQRYIDYGVKHFKRQIENELGNDGLWPESVHTYHFYPMRGFLQFAEAAANAELDLYNYEPRPGQSLLAMFRQPLYYMYPDFQLPAINDGWFNTLLPTDLYELGYDRLRDPVIGSVLKDMRSLPEYANVSPDVNRWWSILHAVPVTEVSKPALGPVDFSNIGIATLRMEAAGSEKMMTLDYGRFLGHGQLDKMGITLFGDGKLLSADYGTPSYGSEILRYYKTSISHNVIYPTGKDQSVTTDSELLTYHLEEELQVAVVQTSQALPGTNWHRVVAMTDSYVLLWDSMESTAVTPLTWTLHGPTSATQVSGEAVQTGESVLKSPYASEVRTMSAAGDVMDVRWLGENGAVLMRAVAPTVQGHDHFLAKVPAVTATSKVDKWFVNWNLKNTNLPVVLQTGSETAKDTVSISWKDGLITVSGADFRDDWKLSRESLSVKRTRGEREDSSHQWLFRKPGAGN